MDSAYGVQANYVIRIGSGNPFLGPIQSALDSVPDAINGGIDDLQQALPNPDDFKDVVFYAFPDPAAITNIALPSLSAFQITGTPPDLPSSYPDTSWLLGDSALINFPARLLGSPGTFTGSIKAEVKDIKFPRIRRGTVEANLSIQQLPQSGPGSGTGYLFGISAGSKANLGTSSSDGQDLSIGGTIVFP